jgi:hypothetical protein
MEPQVSLACLEEPDAGRYPNPQSYTVKPVLNGPFIKRNFV